MTSRTAGGGRALVVLVPVDAHLGAGAVGSPVSGPTTPSGSEPGRAGSAPPALDPLGDLVTEGVEELVRAVVESVDAGGGDQRWGTFLGMDPDTRQVVGTCGYRGAPRGGRVEVAFWTFPPFEGRGWATAMARALVERALEHPDVHIVLAHTLPERAPATSVLTAAGLRFTGTVRRDELSDSGTTTVRGRVWRWERRGRW